MNSTHVLRSLAVTVVCIAAATVARADPTLTTLVSFNGADGAGPLGSLVADGNGNLYGTTRNGGAYGYGTAFELSGPAHQTQTTLVSFNKSNGANPAGGLTFDSAGNLFGSTSGGGDYNLGTVFELSGPSHETLSTLKSFSGYDGASPNDGLLIDSNGNVYGTTEDRGPGNPGNGTVFELSGPGHQTLTTLVAFNQSNGAAPLAGLTADAAGNLYGTTSAFIPPSGASGGIVFELSGANHQTFRVAANFTNAVGPRSPAAALTIDSHGNLYGTSQFGGNFVDGTVFELAANNPQTVTVLKNFDGFNGNDPVGSLLIDTAGNLFGTTSTGVDDGTVFKISLSGDGPPTFTNLAIVNGPDGNYIGSGLTADAYGNLYGTTMGGGANSEGTIFEITGAGFAVPEPSILPLLTVGGLGLLFRRRRLKGQVIG